MSNLAKVAIATVGVGTASGAGIAGYLHFSKDDSSNKSKESILDNSNNYEAHLKKQGRNLLPQDSEYWTSLISKYSSEGEGLLITIDGQAVQKNNLQDTQLKAWCSENSGKSFTNAEDEIYQRVSAWCTEPKTIEQSLNGKTILSDTEPSDGQRNTNEADWTEKVNKYKEDQNTDLINEISEESQESSEIPAKDFSDAKKLRAWCRFSKAKHFKHEKDSRYLKYLNWCTK